MKHDFKIGDKVLTINYHCSDGTIIYDNINMIGTIDYISLDNIFMRIIYLESKYKNNEPDQLDHCYPLVSDIILL